MNKTIGIFAHVDAGKTTFAEQLLYHTKSIKHRGRVDHQDAFLDNHEIERQRGITVFADQATFTYQDSTYFLIDNPGHVDFSPEMERSVKVMDYAIVILSAVEGVEGHSLTIWQLLRKHQVPTFIFINKTDRLGANIENVIREIHADLSADVCEIKASSVAGEMKEDLIEFVAERNEFLLERYLESGYQKEIWVKTLKELIKENKVFPCMSGSALQDVGIVDFLDTFHQLTVTQYSKEQSFSGRVYKIRHDDKGTRITFIKAMSGILNVRDLITIGQHEHKSVEKITQIRVYNGSVFKTVDQVQAGELFAVLGLSNAVTGDGVGTLHEKAMYEMVPTLKSKVVFNSSIHSKEVLRYFQQLDVEDPSLQVMWEERLQEIHIHVMGSIQLEILKSIIKDRFHIEVSFDEPQILYKETIGSMTYGYGHFEPLKHYAEVHLKIEPAARNSGITFINLCHANDLSIGYQNLVKSHIFEKSHHGLLTGSPLTDLKITLLTGRADNMHTSGGDFREATLRALRQGLEKTSNLLLEPYYNFTIKVTMDLMGKVLSDIQVAQGSFEPPQTDGKKAIITGKVPVATFMSYAAELASFTQGKGVLNLVFGGYERCHNTEVAIERISYNKDADPDYSSSSIFCSKGKGYTVTWEKAEASMHCS